MFIGLSPVNPIYLHQKDWDQAVPPPPISPEEANGKDKMNIRLGLIVMIGLIVILTCFLDGFLPWFTEQAVQGMIPNSSNLSCFCFK